MSTAPVHMPQLAGGTGWLNSEPLTARDLRGHVVVVNFWTFTCINWLRQEPYVRAWWQTYRVDGLVMIGVHTPEFSFEHDLDRVARAVKEREITYPVIADNDYEIWSTFDNHYWPALYFIGVDGVIRGTRFGEGDYERSERAIQRLLGVDSDLVPGGGVGLEAPADWGQLRTPETYLGYGRSVDYLSSTRHLPDLAHTYESPDRLPFNQWALAGRWTVERERAVVADGGGSIAFRFHARDVHLVMSPGQQDAVPFQVLLDGAPPGPAHGVDVDEDGRGVLTDAGLHQLIRQTDRVHERTVQITFASPGAEAYAFTFG